MCMSPKVVVSHNLAEEILDEIYGKIEDNTDKESSAGAGRQFNSIKIIWAIFGVIFWEIFLPFLMHLGNF